jgi:cytochrome P450
VSTIAELELPAFDYGDDTLKGPRFQETMRELRERSWVARVEPIGFVVLDQESVAFFMRSKSAEFPGRLLYEAQGITEGTLYERAKGTLLGRSGEDHRRLRKLVQPAFTPAATDALRPAIRDWVTELLAAFADEGRCEFVTSFAKPLPAKAIATVMGAPLEDAERLGVWANKIQGQFDPIKVSTQLDELNRAAEEFLDYVRDLIAKRHENPGDDLITTLLQAEEEGDKLTEEECLDVVSSVLVGGVDTTQSQLAQGVRLFAEHPDQWTLLADDPSLSPRAVEEVLRFEPIAPLTGRVLLEDVEHRGVRFPKDTLVFAAAVAANRDPEEYDQPETFDITADRGRAKPLSFGAGPHFCLGANLAKAELEEAFPLLAQRMPNLELDGEPVYDTPLGVYGLLELRLRFGG